MSAKSFGFLWGEGLPEGRRVSREIAGAETTRWATTGEFDDVARDHCAAVLVCNLALYFQSRGLCAAAPSKRETFLEAHRYVGDGPVAALAGKAKAYFAARGCALVSGAVAGFEAFCAAIDSGDPCAVLLSRGIVSWHWVLGVGYRTYDSGERFLRIVDGWHDSADVYYPLANGGWRAATRFSLR